MTLAKPTIVLFDMDGTTVRHLNWIHSRKVSGCLTDKNYGCTLIAVVQSVDHHCAGPGVCANLLLLFELTDLTVIV